MCKQTTEFREECRLSSPDFKSSPCFLPVQGPVVGNNSHYGHEDKISERMCLIGLGLLIKHVMVELWANYLFHLLPNRIL